MGRQGIEQLLFAMERAFEGEAGLPKWHSLLGNLRAVRADDWRWVPPGGRRSIRDIVDHLGARYVWDSQAFGDGSIHWNRPGSAPVLAAEATPAEAEEWLRDAHGRLRGHVAALADDAELDRERMTPQGVMRPTRFIVTTMIEHDLYHCGEVNHIRALRQGDDY